MTPVNSQRIQSKRQALAHPTTRREPVHLERLNRLLLLAKIAER